MNRRIVQQTIRQLLTPEQGHRIEWDSEIPGFGVRVTATSAKSFILDYRLHGRQRRYTFGQWPEMTATAARTEALEIRARIKQGHDPMEERSQSRQEPTLAH